MTVAFRSCQDFCGRGAFAEARFVEAVALAYESGLVTPGEAADT